MQSREIPRSEWRNFFLDFSERYDAEPVAVEVTGASIGMQVESRNLHLRGISQVRKRDDSALAVMLDADDGTRLTHMVARPMHVSLQHNALDNTDTLEIESEDGTTTLVRLGMPAAAELPRVERFPRKGDDEDISE